MKNRINKIIPYLLGIILLIYIIKPNISFKSSGQLREYGIGYDSHGYKKTLYTTYNIILFITILLYAQYHTRNRI